MRFMHRIETMDDTPAEMIKVSAAEFQRNIGR